ncbi:MAG: DMT family transporter [Candidatus Aminicenantaceae bacterium]
MKKKRSLAEIHVAVVLFGIAGLFGKWIALAPSIIVLGRVFFASITLALILLISKQTIIFPKKSTYFLLVSLGFLLAVHWTVFFKSIQISTVAVGLLSYSSFPVFTAFLEPLFFKEKIQIKNLFYAGVCVFGIFLIIPKFDLSDAVFQGVLWGVAAGFTFSLLTIFNRKLSKQYSSLVIAFYQDFFATLVLLPFFFILRPALDLKNIILLCILGIFCTAGSHTLFIKGMKYIRAQTAAIISSLEPVYGIVIAFFFLNEIPTLRTILGGVIILSAAFSVTWSGFRTNR